MNGTNESVSGWKDPVIRCAVPAVCWWFTPHTATPRYAPPVPIRNIHCGFILAVGVLCPRNMDKTCRAQQMMGQLQLISSHAPSPPRVSPIEQGTPLCHAPLSTPVLTLHIALAVGKTCKGAGMGGERKIYENGLTQNLPYLHPILSVLTCTFYFLLHFALSHIDQINGFKYLTLIYEPSCFVTGGKACLVLYLRPPQWFRTQHLPCVYLPPDSFSSPP